MSRNLALINIERQREGIAIAKAAGKYWSKQSRFSDETMKDIIQAFNDPKTNKAALTREYNITRALRIIINIT
jgi:DNA invertase Pin-like site-specific DNA recombinase